MVPLNNSFRTGGLLLLLVGAIVLFSLPGQPVARAQPLAVGPQSPILAGRNCGSTTLLARAPGRVYRSAEEAPASLALADWSGNTAIDIGDSSDSQGSPSVVVDTAGTVHLLLVDRRQSNQNIAATRSTDSGQTWSTARQVSDDTTPAAQTQPDAWIDADDVIYTIWSDQRRGLNDIYGASSADGGQTWSTNVRVNLDAGAAEKSAPALVGTGGITPTLFAGWTQRTAGAAGADIIVVRSEDGGQTWKRGRPANNQAGSVQGGAFALATDPASGRLYVLWVGNDGSTTHIFIASSADGGLNWSTPVQVSDDAGSTGKADPALVIDSTNGILLAAWEDYRNIAPEIRLDSSADGGQTWSSSSRVDEGDGAAYNPVLVLDSTGEGDCIFCKENGTNSTGNIYAAHIVDGARTTTAQINDEPILSSPSLLSATSDADNTIYAFWTNNSAGSETIYTARREAEQAAQPALFLPIITR